MILRLDQKVETCALNTLKFYPDLCVNCGLCVEVCPHAVFEPYGDGVRMLNAEACIECGACQLNCPAGAVSVQSGVGCAAAMIQAALTGKPESCGGDERCCQ